MSVGRPQPILRRVVRLAHFPVVLHHSLHVMRGHSRPTDGVASLAYDPRIHERGVPPVVLRKHSALATGSWIAGSSPAMTRGENGASHLGNALRAPILAALVLAVFAICLLSAGTTPSHARPHARSMFWSQSGYWWGDYPFRRKRQHKHAESDSTKKRQSQDASKGPLQIIISIADQRISLYENGILIAQSSVSTGVERHPTPLGVFSVIGKKKWHRSNIYSGAPMPYMQRITWSGIALHAGDLPGYPASHGCIRLTNAFAIRLWHLTKRGTRVIIAPEDVRPVEITNPQLFAQKPRVASMSPESGTPTLASNDGVAAAGVHAPLVSGIPVSSPDEGAKASDPASAGARARKVVPISVFVSRQSSRLFVRRGFTPLFDVPITIRNPAEPTGTHVFSVMESKNLESPNEDAAIRWTVVSVPERSSLIKEAGPRLHKEPLVPDKANAVLGRIDIPQDAVDRITPLLTPGSSLIISDHGISRETGKDTDFIVLTR
jgi:hypothetical protein